MQRPVRVGTMRNLPRPCVRLGFCCKSRIGGAACWWHSTHVFRQDVPLGGVRVDGVPVVDGTDSARVHDVIHRVHLARPSPIFCRRFCRTD